MEIDQECDTNIRCPECGKPMYLLKGALSPIFVCSRCGSSVDEKTLHKNLFPESESKNGNSRPLLQNLFSGQFMKKYTAFDSFSDFINNCDLFCLPFDEISQDMISDLPERKINRYVKEHTSFDSWDQMFEKAVEWYLKM